MEVIVAREVLADERGAENLAIILNQTAVCLTRKKRLPHAKDENGIGEPRDKREQQQKAEAGAKFLDQRSLRRGWRGCQLSLKSFSTTETKRAKSPQNMLNGAQFVHGVDKRKLAVEIGEFGTRKNAADFVPLLQSALNLRARLRR